MPSKILLVESVTKAKEIQHILGSDYRVQATLGHIKDLPRDELGVEYHPEAQRPILFTLHVLERKRELVGRLRAMCKDADVIIASDPDREGEAIAWHVNQEVSGIARSVTRAEFHAITEKEIRQSVNNPRAIDYNRVSAQVSRRIIDRLVGYILSPMAAQAMGLGYANVSVGRVQSAVLWILVDRERAIRHFIPEPFWKVVLEDAKGAKFASERIDSQPEAEAAMAAYQKNGAAVLDIKAEIKKDFPPSPLTASTLQQIGSKQFGWSPKHSMGLAQKLFEGQHITYHRTDSKRLGPDKVAAIRAYLGGVDPALVPAKAMVHKNSSRVQDAHEAIHPVDLTPAGAPSCLASRLEADEAKLYEVIWNVTMASQCRPAEWEVTTVTAGSKGTDVVLSATGRRLVVEGYRRFIPSNDKDLPTYGKQEYLVGAPYVNNEFTKPPSRFNNATIIKEMEKLGIGRPSTYAPTISTLLDRLYVNEDKKLLVPTERGEKCIDWLSSVCPEVVNTGFTAQMESDLDTVELGERAWEEPVKQILAVLSNANATARGLDTAPFQVRGDGGSASVPSAKKGAGSSQKKRAPGKGARGTARTSR